MTRCCAYVLTHRSSCLRTENNRHEELCSLITFSFWNVFTHLLHYVSQNAFVCCIDKISKCALNTKTELHQLTRHFLLWHLHCRTSCSSMLHWTRPKCILGILNKTRRISPTNAFSFILSLGQLSTASKLMGCAALTNTKTFTFCNISVVSSLTASKLTAMACYFVRNSTSSRSDMN